MASIHSNMHLCEHRDCSQRHCNGLKGLRFPGARRVNPAVQSDGQFAALADMAGALTLGCVTMIVEVESPWIKGA